MAQKWLPQANRRAVRKEYQRSHSTRQRSLQLCDILLEGNGRLRWITQECHRAPIEIKKLEREKGQQGIDKAIKAEIWQAVGLSCEKSVQEVGLKASRWVYEEVERASSEVGHVGAGAVSLEPYYVQGCNDRLGYLPTSCNTAWGACLHVYEGHGWDIKGKQEDQEDIEAVNHYYRQKVR